MNKLIRTEMAGQNLTRREMLGKSARSLGSIFLAAHGISCAIPAGISIHTSHRDIGATSSLRLIPEKTTLTETIAEMKKKGATNISLSGGLDARDSKTVLHALTADHLGAVMLFKNTRYAKSLSLEDRREAVDIYLKILRIRDSNAIAVVSENMISQGVCGVLIIREHPAALLHVPYNLFPEWLHGVKDPLIMGDDLELGVTFIARKAAEVYGEFIPWDYGIILRHDGKRFSAEQIFAQKLLFCECISDWYNDPPEKRKKNGMVAPFLDF